MKMEVYHNYSCGQVKMEVFKCDDIRGSYGKGRGGGGGRGGFCFIITQREHNCMNMLKL